MRRGVALAAGIVVWSSAMVGTGWAHPVSRQSYVIVLRNSVDAAEKTDQAEQAGDFQSDFRYTSALKGFAARLTLAQVKRLRNDPDVQFVSDDRSVRAVGSVPVATGESVPTGVRRVEAATASTVRQASVANVAVIDTGVSLTHPDLNATSGANCVTPGASAADDNGHGTHVAGTIAARNNGAGVVGVVPDTKVYAVKVLDSSGSGTWSQVICGIDWVTANAAGLNIRVANMSLGGDGLNDNSCGSVNADALHAAICNSAAAGVTYAVAAGNDGIDFSAFSPANYPEVLAVTAIADSDGAPGGRGAPPSCFPGESDDFAASFSNFAIAPTEVNHTI
ncbi:MAG: S8 family serine peptidase, partial [Actinomycetota bacterium]|nr:S8 family serine peptidase [Actinomycetota bacterium]